MLIDDLRPRVLERDRAVEYRRPLAGVRIDAEVTQPLELESGAGSRFGERGLDFAVNEPVERVGIEIAQRIAITFARVCRAEQAVVERTSAVRAWRADTQ